MYLAAGVIHMLVFLGYVEMDHTGRSMQARHRQMELELELGSPLFKKALQEGIIL
jgi:hypothetical protein